jgi:DNA-binding LacI/PurR family transcriptional regulator
VIGFLLDNIYESYGVKIWSGVVAAAQSENVRLVCFVGGSLQCPYNYLSQRNAIYDLASSNNLDGIVSMSGSLGNYVGTDALEDFYVRFDPIPIVSIAAAVNGRPSLLVDNEFGMRKLMEHLVEAHGFSRVAFIRGPECNPEAEIRFRVYREILEGKGRGYDPSLVVPGDFTRTAGTRAVRILLDERNVRFDALVGANDYSAIYAMKALADR